MNEPPNPSLPSAPAVPDWLAQRLVAAGGSVPFATYMQWVLHDPQVGAYATGRLRVGPTGDFATSPSLGPDFAALLTPQLVEWFGHWPQESADRLCLVETGPGEGSLALDLANSLVDQCPGLANRLDLVLVEPNRGMAERQRQWLVDCPIPVRWASFDELAQAPVRGVVLAHEVLDALPVERIEWDGALWRQQEVRLQGDPSQGFSLRLAPGEPLSPEQLAQLEPYGLLVPNPHRLPGWCSEWHSGVQPWLAACGGALAQGFLLVVDYALEAWRYYANQRSQGTLMAYRQQTASADPLAEPGHWDLTAHLCLDALQNDAKHCGWQPLGQCRQGEALLALGLAQRLHGLQQLDPADLAMALARRESLLRLVDPAGLGEFRWMAFGRGLGLEEPALPRFLRPPGPPTSC